MHQTELLDLKETKMDNKTSRHKNNLYDKCSYLSKFNWNSECASILLQHL